MCSADFLQYDEGKSKDHNVTPTIKFTILAIMVVFLKFTALFGNIPI
jgi:hypothetical protein